MSEQDIDMEVKMAELYYRFRLDLAVKQSIYEALTQAQRDRFIEAIREMKRLTSKINTGTGKKEDTTVARWHLCRHELREPCSAEQDI